MEWNIQVGADFLWRGCESWNENGAFTCKLAGISSTINWLGQENHTHTHTHSDPQNSTNVILFPTNYIPFNQTNDSRNIRTIDSLNNWIATITKISFQLTK